jgi:Tfp pilus assembly protein PilP
MKRLLIPAAIALAAGGCSSEMDELKQFVRDSEKGVTRRVEPLPAVKPFEPFAYEGFDLPDPFKPRKIASGDQKRDLGWKNRSTAARSRSKPSRSSSSRWWERFRRTRKRTPS